MRKIICAFMIGLLFAVVPISTTGCAHPVPTTITTPQGKVAFQMEDVVDAVNAVQHEAITLSHAGKLSRETTLKIVKYRRFAVNVIDKAIDAGTGKDAALTDVDNGLAELEKQLTSQEQALLRVSVGSVRTVIAALKGK